LGVHADQLRGALTNIPGERLSGGLPSNLLCGRSAAHPVGNRKIFAHFESR
jgi:hypothetical protein